MANGKKPTRRQMEVIEKFRLKPANWLVLKNPTGKLHILHKHSGKKRIITYM